MLEEPASSFVKLNREDKLESTAETDEVPYTDGDDNKSCQGEENVPLGEDDQGDIGQHQFHVTSANTKRSDEDEKISDKRTDPTCCVPDDDKKEDVLGVGHSQDKVKPQNCDPGRAEGAEFSCDQSSKPQSSVSDCKKESINGQIEQEMDTETEEASASRSYVFGFLADKLSEAYKDAGRRLQGTRDIIRNVQLAEMKVVLSQYVTMVSKELPLIHQLQLQPQPEPEISAESKVPLVDLPVPQKCSISVILDISGCPEGSVSLVRNTSPEVFHQKLVELPSALSQLQTSSSQEIQEHLESRFPQMQGSRPLGIFWLRTANRKHPVPKPGCLLLSEKDVVVVSADRDSTETLTVFHHFKLLEIKEVQISLAGQHVRLIGSTEDTVLAVFTHSKDLTQEFCKALLKALSPETVLEGHPLLSDDLMVLSLDWTSNVPDIFLDSGLSVTSRFKRVLADLLYIVHGNMEAPGKPSLANIRPLFYASVKVKNAPHVLPGAIIQFLLTDTHVALLREDGVFHPVPRGSSLVPARPQFQGLELRQRSDIRYLLVKQDGGCLVVEIVFTNHKPQKRKVVLRRGSADPTGAANISSNSWKLCFGCTTEAQILIKHLCV